MRGWLEAGCRCNADTQPRWRDVAAINTQHDSIRVLCSPRGREIAARGKQHAVVVVVVVVCGV